MNTPYLPLHNLDKPQTAGSHHTISATGFATGRISGACASGVAFYVRSSDRPPQLRESLTWDADHTGGEHSRQRQQPASPGDAQRRHLDSGEFRWVGWVAVSWGERRRAGEGQAAAGRRTAHERCGRDERSGASEHRAPRRQLHIPDTEPKGHRQVTGKGQPAPPPPPPPPPPLWLPGWLSTGPRWVRALPFLGEDVHIPYSRRDAKMKRAGQTASRETAVFGSKGNKMHHSHTR